MVYHRFLLRDRQPRTNTSMENPAVRLRFTTGRATLSCALRPALARAAPRCGLRAYGSRRVTTKRAFDHFTSHVIDFQAVYLGDRVITHTEVRAA